MKQVQITKVDNGYHIRLENDLAIAKVFNEYDDTVRFIEIYFDEWGRKNAIGQKEDRND